MSLEICKGEVDSVVDKLMAQWKKHGKEYLNEGAFSGSLGKSFVS